ncbi:MAG TPA: lysophospholipid acyltransferase family protein [Acidimicrobiales bacterium]|nr:lysophospholipid acyltransferase family protein [Acidimicrobiales bacterium]
MAEPVTRPLSRVQRVFYAVVRLVVVGAAKLWFRVEVHGAEHLPARGAYVLAPAHRSNLDTPLLAVVTRRPLRYMGKDSLWKAGRFGAWFLNSLGGFPVARGSADREALRAAEEVLRRGEPLVMFPEGTRREGPTIQPLFDGPAFVAARTDAPIVPIGIGGTEAAMGRGVKIPRRQKVTFVVGAPILPPARAEGARPPRSAVRAITAELHERVQDLFDEAQRLAGTPNPPA